MDIIQNSKLLNAIKEMSQSVFLFLNLFSLLVLCEHYFHLHNLDPLIELVISYFPVFVTVMLAREVFEHKEFILYSLLLSIIQPNYLYSYFIVASFYLIDHIDTYFKKKYYIQSIPQFVENSCKDLITASIALMMALGMMKIPSFSIHLAFLDSLVFIGLVVFMHCLFFYCGYHPRLIAFFLFPIEIFFLYENICNFYLGAPLVHLLTHGTMSALCSLSGTGVTIGIALLNKKLPENTLTSALFGVNEPVIFGLPVTKNKKAFLPFVIGGTFLGMIPIFLMKSGYLNYPILDAPYIGLGLEGLLVTLDIRVIPIQLLQILLSILCWLPYYRKECKHEI